MPSVGPRIRRCEIDSQSTFELICELAIALAGFGGVAAAFGGSDRTYAPAEGARLQALFAHSFLALLVSLTVISLNAFGLDAEFCYLSSSVVGVLGQAPLTWFFVTVAYGFAADPEASTKWPVFWLILGLTSLPLLFFVASVIAGGSRGFLVSGLSAQLVFGLWAFTRVLTHRN